MAANGGKREHGECLEARGRGEENGAALGRASALPEPYRNGRDEGSVEAEFRLGTRADCAAQGMLRRGFPVAPVAHQHEPTAVNLA